MVGAAASCYSLPIYSRRPSGMRVKWRLLETVLDRWQESENMQPHAKRPPPVSDTRVTRTWYVVDFSRVSDTSK
jgi:hypothetical protein